MQKGKNEGHLLQMKAGHASVRNRKSTVRNVDLDQFFLQTGDPVSAAYLLHSAFESAMVIVVVIFEDLHAMERMSARHSLHCMQIFKDKQGSKASVGNLVFVKFEWNYFGRITLQPCAADCRAFPVLAHLAPNHESPRSRLDEVRPFCVVAPVLGLVLMCVLFERRKQVPVDSSMVRVIEPRRR